MVSFKYIMKLINGIAIIVLMILNWVLYMINFPDLTDPIDIYGVYTNYMLSVWILSLCVIGLFICIIIAKKMTCKLITVFAILYTVLWLICYPNFDLIASRKVLYFESIWYFMNLFLSIMFASTLIVYHVYRKIKNHKMLFYISSFIQFQKSVLCVMVINDGKKMLLSDDKGVLIWDSEFELKLFMKMKNLRLNSYEIIHHECEPDESNIPKYVI